MSQATTHNARSNPAAECDKLAAALPSLIEASAQQHRQITADMEALKRAGLIYAKPHLREKKYLYLIYPTDESGNRKREYVGTDEKKIKDAHDAMARAQEYDLLAAELSRIEKRLDEGRNYLKDATKALRV